MVLKNSKWDKKAKYKYMKKHGIAPSKPTPMASETSHSKWSSKKQIDSNEPTLEDSEDEWDSDVDEALINHFYPQLADSSGELSLEQKIKIKKQILQELEENNEGAEEEGEGVEGEELDGIYLGSKENQDQEMQSQKTEKFNLEEFMLNIENKPKKTRKLLSNKMSDNFLEEYGLSSYSDITKQTDDYNDMYFKKLKNRNIEQISAAELDGFVIGESSLNDNRKPAESKGAHVRYLTEEEKKQDEARNELVKQQKFYNEIKTKFDSDKKVIMKRKVIEINNFNADDESQMDALNKKLAQTDIASGNIDDDIDYLLGIDKNQKSQPEDNPKKVGEDFDSFFNEVTSKEDKKSNVKSEKPKFQFDKQEDEDFLNGLLK
ncbi:uncharacterized protein J8A68_001330 [[Candida] subhashii]|uniref:Uncharacterized protein n=1 Tax=[Candida] subhashii TaxID=561895 RepID=A0A8J5QPK1_9ASCO|nr:uncharacterized protein J8A68_001330 [[Candida] subhashii]KAG7665274.1 hypothetical protein J8A68_001330 [[Candida] subhashii]